MQNDPSQVHDWIIIGGGPHGVCAARALRSQGLSVRILDPSGRLLDRWTTRAASVAMAWMRSPASHHLNDKPTNLNHFVRQPENADVSSLSGVFRVPTHDAFLRHSHATIEEYQLDSCRVQGRADSIQRHGDQLLVQGSGVELHGRRVLIATGSNQLRIPEWARSLRAEGAPIHHVFEADAPPSRDLVGGGISAIQRALLVHRQTGRPVRLWMRSPVTKSDFDYDRDWSKHRFVSTWSGLDEPDRLEFLRRNPTRGSATPILAGRLKRAIRTGSIEVECSIPSIEWSPAEGRLLLRVDGRLLESSGITLVTGFAPERVSGWLERAADSLALPMTHGLPRLDRQMHWGQGVYVTGPLALLRLGPMARNIVGARWATSMLPSVRMQPV